MNLPARRLFPLGLVPAVLLVDIASKAWAAANLPSGAISMLKGSVCLSLRYDNGGFGGMLPADRALLPGVAAALVVILAGFYVFEKAGTAVFDCGAALLIAGTAGNIIDRLVPGRQGIVDFISVGIEAVYRSHFFNIADASILAGCCLLLVHYLFLKKGKE